MWRFVVLGAVAAIAVSIAVMVLGAAIFWLWLFGDDPWPGWAEVALVVTAYAIGLATFVGFGLVGYRRRRTIGKERIVG